MTFKNDEDLSTRRTSYLKKIQREKEGKSFVEDFIREGRTPSEPMPGGRSISIFDAIGVRIPTNPNDVKPIHTADERLEASPPPSLGSSSSLSNSHSSPSCGKSLSASDATHSPFLPENLVLPFSQHESAQFRGNEGSLRESNSKVVLPSSVCSNSEVSSDEESPLDSPDHNRRSSPESSQYFLRKAPLPPPLVLSGLLASPPTTLPSPLTSPPSSSFFPSKSPCSQIESSQKSSPSIASEGLDGSSDKLTDGRSEQLGNMIPLPLASLDSRHNESPLISCSEPFGDISEKRKHYSTLLDVVDSSAESEFIDRDCQLPNSCLDKVDMSLKEVHRDCSVGAGSYILTRQSIQRDSSFAPTVLDANSLESSLYPSDLSDRRTASVHSAFSPASPKKKLPFNISGNLSNRSLYEQPSSINLQSSVKQKKTKSLSRKRRKSLSRLHQQAPISDFTWTTRFHHCVEKLSKITMASQLDDRIEANTELMHLSDDFVHAARTFGRIIISEVFLPVKQKTIRPKTIGGIVGGEKYIVHNILFKFAFDLDSIFGGNDAAAAKVSEQELKGLMTFYSLDIPKLYFPMMAIVRYRGFTLVAMTLLPVNRSTLVYGSSDGGRTVVMTNKRFGKVMMHAGKKLNLRPHLCGCNRDKSEILWCAADIEGHIGYDGKMYLLDFGRAMPPVTPNKKFHNGHIYQLFRREFVLRYQKSLCSDAFSGFAVLDEKFSEFNRDVDDATKHLFGVVIPECGRKVLEMVVGYADAHLMVVNILHESGVNLRYIGRVVGTFQSHNLMIASLYGDDLVQEATRYLLLEATARVIKNQLNTKLRLKMKEVKEPLEVVYRQLVVDFLNLVFGSFENSELWWAVDLVDDLSLHFSVGKYLVIGNQNGMDYSTWRQVCLFTVVLV
jgi:hypothetical protein